MGQVSIASAQRRWRSPGPSRFAFSTASTSSIAPASAKQRVLMLYFNTYVGATPASPPVGLTRGMIGGNFDIDEA